MKLRAEYAVPSRHTYGRLRLLKCIHFHWQNMTNIGRIGSETDNVAIRLIDKSKPILLAFTTNLTITMSSTQ